MLTARCLTLEYGHNGANILYLFTSDCPKNYWLWNIVFGLLFVHWLHFICYFGISGV